MQLLDSIAAPENSWAGLRAIIADHRDGLVRVDAVGHDAPSVGVAQFDLLPVSYTRDRADLSDSTYLPPFLLLLFQRAKKLRLLDWGS